MKRYWLAALAALCCALFAAGASAQLQQPIAATPAAMRNVYYQENGQRSPSDVMTEEPTEDEPEVSEEAAEEQEDEGPVHLFCPCHCGIQIGGWINGGFYQNGDGNTFGFGNAPIPFGLIADAPMLNQAWIYADKPLPDAENCCCDWGFHVDYIFGTDGPDTQAFGDIGWDTTWDSGRDYGSAIPQLYVEYGNSDCSVKAGHFYTVHGYEVVQATGNFFYSHAYCMYYGEPFTHTGVMLTKQLTSQLRASGGYVQGWDSGFNNANDADTFMGHVYWTGCDDKLSVAYAINVGDWGSGDVLNAGDIYTHSLVAIYNINECMQYVFQQDYSVNWNLPGGASDTEWYGINQYLFYTCSSCHKLGLRAEWFDDADGARTGFEGDFFEITLGLNYTPNANLIMRPEVRWDWFDGPKGVNPYNPNRFGVGRDDDQFYYGMDVIVIY